MITIAKDKREKKHDKERDDKKNIYLKSESIVLYLKYCTYIMSHDTANLNRKIRDL
jgi:hypothetical protein